ncbi:MAG TPA: hypothetical protein VIW94_06410 [Acidimicrobiia bacterium]
MYVLLGIFKDRDDPDTVIDELRSAGIAGSAIGVVWREKIVHVEEEIEVVTYVDHFDGPAMEARKGAWGGLIGGAATGVASAILASAGVILAPGVAVLIGAGTAVAVAAAAAAGAAGGSITGGAIGALLGATDHDATKVTTHEIKSHDATESDGFVITIETEEEQTSAMAELLTRSGAGDITVLGGDDHRLRIHLD